MSACPHTCSCTSDMECPHDCPCAEESGRVYGMCTCCGSVEVALDCATGFRDLSSIGESDRYPTGYGCEVCS